jgi:hypothetical protein
LFLCYITCYAIETHFLLALVFWSVFPGIWPLMDEMTMLCLLPLWHKIVVKSCLSLFPVAQFDASLIHSSHFLSSSRILVVRKLLYMMCGQLHFEVLTSSKDVNPLTMLSRFFCIIFCRLMDGSTLSVSYSIPILTWVLHMLVGWLLQTSCLSLSTM